MTTQETAGGAPTPHAVRHRQRHLLLGERRGRHVVPRPGHLRREPHHRRPGGRLLGDGPAGTLFSAFVMFQSIDVKTHNVQGDPTGM